MTASTSVKKTLKQDFILMLCLLFDITNVVVYLHSLTNYSFLTILTIFLIGFANVLFAVLIYFRTKSHNYLFDFGQVGLSQSMYYIKTIYRGAAFIAVDFLAVFVILWLCIHFAGGVPEQAVHHCSSSIEPGTNTDIAGFIQYSFDNMACHTGNSKYLSFISIEQDNFVIVALNRLLSANVIGNTLWPVILFGSLIISVLPFIWIFIRCVHCLFLIIKGKEANK